MIDEAKEGGEKGFKDTWGLVLMKRGDKRAVTLEAIVNG